MSLVMERLERRQWLIIALSGKFNSVFDPGVALDTLWFWAVSACPKLDVKDFKMPFSIDVLI
jgi:hypothetical protein